VHRDVETLNDRIHVFGCCFDKIVVKILELLAELGTNPVLK
jgi:hypothetical protein